MVAAFVLIRSEVGAESGALEALRRIPEGGRDLTRARRKGCLSPKERGEGFFLSLLVPPPSNSLEAESYG